MATRRERRELWRSQADGENRSDQFGAYGDAPPRNAQGTGRRRRGGLIGGMVRGVAAGIGLARESYHHHQEKKKNVEATGAGSSHVAESADGQPQPQARSTDEKVHGEKGHDDGDSSGHDEDDDLDDLDANENWEDAAWHLEDVQLKLAPPPDYDTAIAQDTEEIASRFIATHPAQHSQSTEKARLPMPVILPQRRPGERARGFIQAYAPLLQTVGIDKASFADFINDLNKATMPSPWINAINVASIAVQHVPEPVTIAVSIAAQLATAASLQAHSRSKTNVFLDKVNAEYFRPLGLIALIMTWKPSRSNEVVTQITLDAALQQATESASGQGGGITHGISHKMQASHGTTAFEWPESAPLVFPTLDKCAGSAEGEQAVEDAAKKTNGVVRSMIFTAQYLDKRGQAYWAAQNPDSNLAQLGVKPEFHSRYSDPNHPASSGSLVGLLTGGALSGRLQSARKQARRERRAARRDMRSDAREQRGPTLLGTVGPGALIRGMKKILHEVFIVFRVKI
ncbi:hypothetical protein NQ176_g4887 [Zarea fungicola]|uniref:Uncharacterized protein n=1 Tax=Zarea fungicola TaxID=93591 RepID=A0ACC1NDP5_9HYPO|nr:hypothetical protein NQ176_g4887 [Lecanicillium fungicola]